MEAVKYLTALITDLWPSMLYTLKYATNVL